jgi:hypothetical protein
LPPLPSVDRDYPQHAGGEQRPTSASAARVEKRVETDLARLVSGLRAPVSASNGSELGILYVGTSTQIELPPSLGCRGLTRVDEHR